MPFNMWEMSTAGPDPVSSGRVDEVFVFYLGTHLAGIVATFSR